MRIWSNSTVLLLIDSIAIAIAQGYMLTRARMTSHPSSVLRVTAMRDSAIWNNQLLKRKLAGNAKNASEFQRSNDRVMRTIDIQLT